MLPVARRAPAVPERASTAGRAPGLMTTNFVHRFVPAETAGGPTLLALHGTGGDEHDLLPLARMVAPQAAVLSPRGKVLEQGAPRFFKRYAEGVLDLEDLRLRTIELAEFVDEATQHYGLDPARVFAIGYSNGANIAASVLLTTPAVLAGAILMRPILPYQPETLPDLTGKPILVSAGRNDPIVLPVLTDKLAALFTSAGAIVTSRWYETGHSLSPREIENAAAWFRALEGV